MDFSFKLWNIFYISAWEKGKNAEKINDEGQIIAKHRKLFWNEKS